MRWRRGKNPDVIDGLGGGGAVAGQPAGIPPSEDPERATSSPADI